MEFGAVAAFWAVSLLFVIMPGADWAYAIAAGLRHRTVLPAVGGLLSGHVIATFVVAAGVGALVAELPMALTALTVAGAAYLVWLGASTLIRPSVPEAGQEQSADSAIRQALRGAGVSGLNPKVFLLFLALLPQFTDPGAPWPVALQIIVLGLVHTATCAAVYTAVGLGARRVLRTRPTAARLTVRISGVALIVIAAGLLVEQVIA